MDRGSIDSEQPALHCVCQPGTRRENTQRVNAATIIRVSRCSGQESIHQIREYANHMSTEKPDPANVGWSVTFDNVTIHQRPRRRFLYTPVLATCQLVMCAMARNYEVCRAAPAESCRGPWTLDPETLASTLAPLLNYLQTPPTSLFVLVTMAYGALAMFQHHLNQTDRLQGLSLFFGIIVGGVIVFPSLARPDKGVALVSPMGFCITCTLTISAAAHWFYRTFLKPTGTVLDTIAGRPTKETDEVDIDRLAV